MADLVTLDIETTLGARYMFPDMPRETFLRALPSAQESGQLILVNVSSASMSMPMRIVRHIKVGEEVAWSRGK